MKSIMYKGKNICLSEGQENELRSRLDFHKYRIKVCSIITGVGLLLGSYGFFGDYKDIVAKKDLKNNFSIKYENYLNKKHNLDEFTLIHGIEFTSEQREELPFKNRWINESTINYFSKNKYLEDKLSEIKKDEDNLICKLNIVKKEIAKEKKIAKKPIESQISEIENFSGLELGSQIIGYDLFFVGILATIFFGFLPYRISRKRFFDSLK